jgi:oxygen-independent coproporphyrinogen-3 oxidase
MTRDASAQDPGFAVYIHWPFCKTICPYCDFNVHTSGDIDQAAWLDALTKDLDHVAGDTPGRTVTSLYFGGGTPSLMPPKTVAALIAHIAKRWSVADDVEITLETNPTSSEAARLREFKDAGVNRLSVGLQALNDDALLFLGRDHSADDGRQVLAQASALFKRVTFDLIYARPDQTTQAWRAELAEALSLAGDHVSLYQLTIESGTPFMKAGIHPADEDIAADMFEITQTEMTAKGLQAYEISNHARPGHESRHNLTCWRGGDYVGIGPGAHGRLTLDGQTFGTHQIHNPARWLQKVSDGGHGTAKRRALSTQDRTRELLMMGLRLSEGIDKRRANLHQLDDVINTEALQMLIDGGLMVDSETQLRATADGRQRLNAVLAKLLT